MVSVGNSCSSSLMCPSLALAVQQSPGDTFGRTVTICTPSFQCCQQLQALTSINTSTLVSCRGGSTRPSRTCECQKSEAHDAGSRAVRRRSGVRCTACSSRCGC